MTASWTLDRVRELTDSRAVRRVAMGAAVVGVTTLVLTRTAVAQDNAADSAFDTTLLPALFQKSNLLWIVIGAAMVMFMQAGFAALEPASSGPRTAHTRWR